MVKSFLLVLAASTCLLGAHASPHAGHGDLFNEDFDKFDLGTPTATTFTTVVKDGSLEVVEDDGNKVLRIQTQGNGYAFINLDLTDLKTSGISFFGRANVRVVEYPTAPDFAHWIMVEASDSTDNQGVLVRPLGGQFSKELGGNYFGVGSDRGATSDWTKFRESAPAENNVWQCLEFEMKNDDSVITVSIDGKEKPDLTVSKNAHGGADQKVDFLFPKINNFKFGWQLFDTGSTPTKFTVDMDDLALSTTPVHC